MPLLINPVGLTRRFEPISEIGLTTKGLGNNYFLFQMSGITIVTRRQYTSQISGRAQGKIPTVIADHFASLPCTAIVYYRTQLADDEMLWSHSMSCRNLLALGDLAPPGHIPQQIWLRDRLIKGGPADYVNMQIEIWKAADPWAHLPLAGQLPLVGPDMEDLGPEGAWDLLWFPQSCRPSAEN